MSERPHAPDTSDQRWHERTSTNPAPTALTRNGGVPRLQLAVVEYDDNPDRGTIHPPSLTGLERMETWMSVDMSSVVDLSTWR
jgi:hypothetical protein